MSSGKGEKRDRGDSRLRRRRGRRRTKRGMLAKKANDSSSRRFLFFPSCTIMRFRSFSHGIVFGNVRVNKRGLWIIVCNFFSFLRFSFFFTYIVNHLMYKVRHPLERLFFFVFVLREIYIRRRVIDRVITTSHFACVRYVNFVLPSFRYTCVERLCVLLLPTTKQKN